MLAAIERSPTLLKEDTHLEDALGATPRFGGDEGNNSSQVGCIPLHFSYTVTHRHYLAPNTIDHASHEAVFRRYRS